MVKIRVRIYVSGIVQGVFFRSSVRNRAMELGIRGFVRNLEDGRVLTVVEGEETSVRRLVEWCKVGPIGAEVEDVEVIPEECKDEFQVFNIVY